jgi:hypothetical protein
MEMAVRKVLAYYELQKRPSRLSSLRKSYRADMRRLRRRFVSLWMSHNRRSEIRIPLSRYDAAIRGDIWVRRAGMGT